MGGLLAVWRSFMLRSPPCDVMGNMDCLIQCGVCDYYLLIVISYLRLS